MSARKYTLTGKIIGYRRLHLNRSIGSDTDMRFPVYAESDPLTITSETDDTIDAPVVQSNITGGSLFSHYICNTIDSSYLSIISNGIKQYVFGLFTQNAFGYGYTTISSITRPASKYLAGTAYYTDGDEQITYTLTNNFEHYGSDMLLSVSASAVPAKSLYVPYIVGISDPFNYAIQSGYTYGSHTFSISLMMGGSSVYDICIPGFGENGSAGGIRIRFDSYGHVSAVSIGNIISGEAYTVSLDGETTQKVMLQDILLGDFTADSSTSTSDSGYSGATSAASDTGSRNPWQTSGNTGIQGGNGAQKPFAGNFSPDSTMAQLSYWSNALDGRPNGVHVFKLTVGQVSDLMGVFWDDTFLDTLTKVFSGNIENCILSLYATQFNAATRGSAANICLGSYDTGVQGQPVYSVSKRSPNITIDIPEYYGTVSDYSSTSLFIYLPYVGYRQIDPQKYMKGGITISIYVDFLRGVASYILYCKSASGIAEDGTWEMDNYAPADIFTASIKNDIPIGASQYANMISGMLSVINGGYQLGTGIGQATTGAAEAIGNIIGGATSVATGAISALTPQYQTIGGVGAGLGLITPARIFVLVMRNCDMTPSNKSDFIGGPSHQSVDRLSQLSGFVKCEQAILGGGIPLDLKEDILQQLRNGVYI